MNPDSIDIQGFHFKKDINSKFHITNLPGRWDTEGHDPHIFYSTLYPTLPLNYESVKAYIPLWYNIRSTKPFLSVHWRRGDRGNTVLGEIGRHLWISTEPRTLAKYINKYLEQNPKIDWVCVSTNSGSVFDRSILQSLVKKELIYINADPNTKPLDLWKWDILSIFLCAASPNLLLSPGGIRNSSAFGRLMYAECLQQNPETAIVEFMPLLRFR